MTSTKLRFLLLPLALALLPASPGLAAPPVPPGRPAGTARPAQVRTGPPPRAIPPAARALPSASGRLRNLYDPTRAADLAKTSAKRLEDAGLTEEQYQSIRGTSVELFKKFDPADHYFISLGRSATQLVAFLQNLNPEVAMNLPASGLGTAPEDTAEPAYFEHFKTMIPDSVLASGKKLVLMDLALSGGSLKNAEKLLRSYLAHRGFKNDLQVLAFTDSAKTIKGVLDQDYHNIVLTGALNPLYNIMSGNEKGEYPEFKVGTTPRADLKRLDYYAQQRDALLHRMQHDQELSTLMSAHH